MKIILLVALILMASYTANAEKCLALAMSGGGDKGAYEAAVYAGLVNNLPAEEVSYDVITGVSAGSLNTLGLSGFAPGEVEEARDFILALWNSIPQYNAYGQWPGGIVQGLFFKKGIFDLSPGIEWVTEQFGNRTVQRKVSFATTDANNADYAVFDYNVSATQPDDLIETAFASSSIPAAFPHITRGERELVDGGVIWNLDVASAVRRCREIADTDSEITIDLVLCGDHKIEMKENIDRYSTLEHLMRGIELKSFYNGMSDYNSSTVLYPDVNFRYLIVPSESLSSGLLPLDFSQKQVDKCFEVGQKDAKNAVLLGPGRLGDVTVNYVDRLLGGEDVWLKHMIQEALDDLDEQAGVASK